MRKRRGRKARKREREDEPSAAFQAALAADRAKQAATQAPRVAPPPAARPPPGFLADSQGRWFKAPPSGDAATSNAAPRAPRRREGPRLGDLGPERRLPKRARGQAKLGHGLVGVLEGRRAGGVWPRRLGDTACCRSLRAGAPRRWHDAGAVLASRGALAGLIADSTLGADGHLLGLRLVRSDGAFVAGHFRMGLPDPPLPGSLVPFTLTDRGGPRGLPADAPSRRGSVVTRRPVDVTAASAAPVEMPCSAVLGDRSGRLHATAALVPALQDVAHARLGRDEVCSGCGRASSLAELPGRRVPPAGHPLGRGVGTESLGRPCLPAAPAGRGAGQGAAAGNRRQRDGPRLPVTAIARVDGPAASATARGCMCARHAAGAAGWRLWVGDSGTTCVCVDVRSVGAAVPPLARFRGYASRPGRHAVGLAVTPDGKFLVAGDRSRAVVWDAARGGDPLVVARMPPRRAGEGAPGLDAMQRRPCVTRSRALHAASTRTTGDTIGWQLSWWLPTVD